jgi:preprotein translocase subunit YajC
MNLISFLSLDFLSMTNTGGGGGGAGSNVMTLLMFGSIFAIFWFMILRPQKKQQDQRKAMLAALKRGDKVVTSGGLFATIKDVKGDRVVATIGDNIKVEIALSAVAHLVEPEVE